MVENHDTPNPIEDNQIIIARNLEGAEIVLTVLDQQQRRSRSDHGPCSPRPSCTWRSSKFC
jgi:hypothetical protein